MLSIFKRLRRDEFEEFFKELFVPLKPIEYLHHPADEVLKAYISGGLGNRWRLDDPQILEQLMQGRLGAWQRAEVSAHLLTCEPCSRKLSGWRAAEPAREQPSGFRRWAYRLGALAAVGVIAFGLWLLLKPSKPLIGYSQPIISTYEMGGAGP